MKLSQNGIKKLAEWEGAKNKVYLDIGGKPTIGMGHLLTQSELSSGKIIINHEKVKYRNGLTDIQMTQLFHQDSWKYEAAVSNNVEVELNQNQFDALVSFTFNVGVSAFIGSSLLEQLNEGDYESVPSKLRQWVYSAGIKSRGLANRREKEIELWGNPWTSS